MNGNLSDQEFFDCYVKEEKWHPLQNHGLVDEDIKLQKEDLDFPYQVTSYLNLFKNNQIKNKKILDIGCGWGRGAYIIKKYLPDNEVTGIDINQSFIDYAKNNYKDVNYFQDDFDNTAMTPPSGYTKIHSYTFSTSDATHYLAYKYLTSATTENPSAFGNFTASSSRLDRMHTVTLALRPA